MPPQRRVDSLNHKGRMGAREFMVSPPALASLGTGTACAVFARIHARSAQLAMPAEYTELEERLERQSLQLGDLLDRKSEPTRKRVVTHCIGTMHEARTTLPHTVHDFVQARIAMHNPVRTRPDTTQAYEEAKTALHDALVNAKWRLPVAQRSGPSTECIVEAIGQAVDGLVKTTFREALTAQRSGPAR